MKFYAQVVGIDSGDSFPSVMLVTETRRYLVNVGEGMQRFCMEHRLRLSRVDGICCTRVTAETLGGLPGMLLTLADMGHMDVTVFGGPGLADLMFAWRHFMQRDDAHIHVVEVPRTAAMHSHADGATDISTVPQQPCGVMLEDVRIQPVVITARAARADASALAQLRADIHSQYHGPAAVLQAFAERQDVPKAHVLAAAAAAAASVKARPSSKAPPVAPAPVLPGYVQPKDLAASSVYSPFHPLKASQWPFDATAPAQACPPPAVTSATLDTMAARVHACDVAMCYIFHAPDIPGKFFPARAAKFGLKPGPAFGRLSRGERVTIDLPVTTARELVRAADIDAGALAALTTALHSLPHDATVLPFEIDQSYIRDPDVIGPGLAVVDCPSIDFLPSLTASSSWRPFQRAASPPLAQAPLAVMFHATPAHVTATAEYVAWVASFPPVTRHVFLCRAPTLAATNAVWPPVCFYSQAYQHCKLHVLHPRAFSLPHPLPMIVHQLLARGGAAGAITSAATHASALQRLLFLLMRDDAMLADNKSTEAPLLTERDGDTTDFVQGEPLTTYTLVPVINAGLKAAAELNALDPRAPLQDMLANADMRTYLSTTPLPDCLSASAPRADGDVPATLAITFTGTSSAIPSKYRNVSGIHVCMPLQVSAEGAVARASMLLDAGEGTLGQLSRRFGVVATQSGDVTGMACVQDVLLSLEMIWISHMHADHHLGIIRLLKARTAALRATAAASCAPRVLIIGPSRLYCYLLEAALVDFDIAHTWHFCDAEHFLHSSDGLPTDAYLRARAAEHSGRGVADIDLTVVKRARLDISVPLRSAAGGAVADDACSTTARRELHAIPIPVPHGGQHTANIHLATLPAVATTFARLGVVAMRTSRALHCPRSYAVRLECVHRDASGACGWSLVYSGDTMPFSETIALGSGVILPTSATSAAVSSLVLHAAADDTVHAAQRASAGCSVLIHESTFDDTDEGRAYALDKRHSTVGDACFVAHAVHAKHLLLTHFSARYPKLPVLRMSAVRAGADPVADAEAYLSDAGHDLPHSEPAPLAAGPSAASSAPSVEEGAAEEARARAEGRTISVAYDLMTVTGADLPTLPDMLPALHILFREEADGADADDSVAAA